MKEPQPCETVGVGRVMSSAMLSGQVSVTVSLDGGGEYCWYWDDEFAAGSSQSMSIGSVSTFPFAVKLQ